MTERFHNRDYYPETWLNRAARSQKNKQIEQIPSIRTERLLLRAKTDTKRHETAILTSIRLFFLNKRFYMFP